MTSLRQQLNRLKTAPTQSLAVERDYSSLLFDRKEAAALNREDLLKIVLSGLKGLKLLDDDFDLYAPELFEKERLNFARSLLDNEAEVELNEKLETFLFRLSSYFHHQACKQALEWLIFRYQVQLFNADAPAISFLPYHSTNSYGRLLSILKIKNLDWAFVEEFAETFAPIPFNVLVRVCHAGHSYHLVSAVSTFVSNAIKSVGSDYMETRMSAYFTFVASLLTAFEDPAKIDNQIVSRVMPFLWTALKLKIAPFKCAGMMIVCSLVMNASLAPEVADNIIKLILLNLKPAFFDLSLETTVVICQRLDLARLPTKPVLKLVKRREELNFVESLLKLMETYDLTAFLQAFWRTLFGVLAECELDDCAWEKYFSVLVQNMDLTLMEERQAKGALNALLDSFEEIVGSD